MAARIASSPRIVVVDGAAIPEFVDVGDDVGVQRVGIGAAVPETDDVELGRCQQFKTRLSQDPAFQISCQRAAAPDHGAELVGTVGL